MERKILQNFFTDYIFTFNSFIFICHFIIPEFYFDYEFLTKNRIHSFLFIFICCLILIDFLYHINIDVISYIILILVHSIISFILQNNILGLYLSLKYSFGLILFLFLI